MAYPPTEPESPPTAAALIIGNELLSGKVIEANVAELARTLRALGIELRRVVMIPDEIDAIVTEVRLLSSTHGWLFTSGGVGPTHDDVTIEAVAKAFGVAVVPSATMESMLRDHYGDRCTEGHLRMALIPEGAALEVTEEVRWPTVRFANTWVMPGIPEVFRMKLPVVVAHIGQGRAFVSRAVYTRLDEGELKPLLDAIVARFPHIAIGSYPKWLDARYKTKLTFDGQDEAAVLTARDAFVELLPAGEPQSLDISDETGSS